MKNVTPFYERFADLSAKRTPLCIGLDPSPAMLQRWNLSDDLIGLRCFCERMIEAVAGRVAVVKPQSAFFERHGPDGMAELKRAVAAIKEHGALALIDAKRGDISSTAAAYGDGFLGADSAFGGDALTLHAFLGFRALLPILEIAKRRGAAVFIVVRSSNPEGAFQTMSVGPDGRSVSEQLADEITEYNCDSPDICGVAGAVVGATLGNEVSKIADRLPNSLLLAPGIGAQGATLKDAKRNFGTHYSRTLPSVSRDVASRGPNLAELVTKVEKYAQLARLDHGRRV